MNKIMLVNNTFEHIYACEHSISLYEFLRDVDLAILEQALSCLLLYTCIVVKCLYTMFSEEMLS